MEFIQKNGRKWKDEETYSKYSREAWKSYHMCLQLESYADDTGDNSVYETEEFKTIIHLRSIRDTLSAEELVKNGKKINKLVNKIIDNLGRDKFITYDDGDVEYIYKYKNKKTKP